MYFVFFFVAFLACLIGKICGMGGGVIIKPILDAFGIMSVASINLISGCTVLGMTCWSVCRSAIKKESSIDLKISTPLAVGAAAGGILGKQLFSLVAGMFADPDKAGGVQAALLFTVTLATLVYTAKKDNIQSCRVKNPGACILIGLLLGMLGSFLGIGGGPFNMAVLFFFFSMPTKTAAQNSLYIILISQAAALLMTLLSGRIPPVIPAVLLGMIICGVAGSEAGGRINKGLSEKSATKLFEAAMILVMAICVFNVIRSF